MGVKTGVVLICKMAQIQTSKNGTMEYVQMFAEKYMCLFLCTDLLSVVTPRCPEREHLTIDILMWT